MIVISTADKVKSAVENKEEGEIIMSKKIVVITGSPRKNGNSFAMTDAFIKAAEEKGHTVTRFDAAMMKLGGKDIAGKECAIIACCEEEDMTVLDGVRIPMERTAALNKWKMVGEVLIPGVLNTGDIDKTDGCAQAAALAEKI